MIGTNDSSNFWVVLDIGTTELKAALVSSKGEIQEKCSRAIQTYKPSSGFEEQDADKWWQLVCEILSEIGSGKNIGAIGLTGQMQNLVLIGENSDLVGPVILYSDQRASEEAREIKAIDDSIKIKEKTGNEQGPSSVLCKLMWMKKHNPEVYKKTSRIMLGSADFISSKLTGKFFTDTTTASTTGLMNLTERQWLDNNLFEKLGLKECIRKLPFLISGGSEIGTLKSDIANRLGLNGEIRVFLGPGDAGANTIGSGCGAPGKAYAYCGTSGWVAFSEQKPADPNSGVITLSHPTPNLFIQVAPLLTAGGNLDWFKEVMEYPSYEEMFNNSFEVTTSKLLYLPYLKGERSPFIDPLARGALIGIDTQTDKKQIGRTVLEGVCMAFKHCLVALCEDMPKQLILTGGTSRSRSFCQLFADVLQVEIVLLNEQQNIGLLGVLTSCGIEKKKTTNHENKENFIPNKNLKNYYAKKYTTFQHAYPTLQPIYKMLSNIQI